MEDTTPQPTPPPNGATTNHDFKQGPSSSAPFPSVQTPQSPRLSGNGAKPRRQSVAQPAPHRPVPIEVAVNSALDESPTMGQLDPAMVAIIAEQVIKKLQDANLTPSQAQQPQFPPVPSSVSATQQSPRSPTQSSTASIPSRYTPPSPDRDRFDANRGTPSPEAMSSDHEAGLRRRSKESLESNLREGVSQQQTPRPLHFSHGESGSMPASMSPTRESRRNTQDGVSTKRADSANETYATRSSRRESRDEYGAASSRQPPPPTVEVPDVAEPTTLEKIWQPLFVDGDPTPRSGQFLRGIAIHLIEDYEPKGSLVVTPHKILQFFEDTMPDSGHGYPWQIIFGGKMTCACISVIYRKLLCQHHMVQTHNHELPGIPALTPHGFEQFLTCLIQAHPEVEFQRLSKAVMNMPISNADDKNERFPKELSRRLLPLQPNVQAEQRLIAALGEPLSQLGIHLKNNGAMPPPPPPASAPPEGQYFGERARQPYTHRGSSNAVEDEDLGLPPSLPIERERKPYTARMGTGRIYEDQDDEAQTQARSQPAGHKSSRQHSGLPTQSHGTHYSNSSSSNAGIPTEMRSSNRDSRSRNTMSQQHVPPPPPPQSGSYSRSGMRMRSPPPNNAYTRSDPANLGGSFEYEPAVDVETDRRYSRSRAQTNGAPAEEEGRAGRPIPTRASQPANIYDPGHGSVGASGPTVGSFSDRRRSMFAGSVDSNSMNLGMGGGGTDGYGSFAGGTNPTGQYPPQNFGPSSRH